jgi:indole-3-glycerol phosphate synthase
MLAFLTLRPRSKACSFTTPDFCFFVVESGYNTTHSLKQLNEHGIEGVLIGEGLSQNKTLLEWFKYEN